MIALVLLLLISEFTSKSVAPAPIDMAEGLPENAPVLTYEKCIS